MAQTIADLTPAVANRLQDPAYTFWNQQWEMESGLAEGINDLMLLVGRPTLLVNVPITLTEDTVWQPMPANMLAITNIRGSSTWMTKTSLRAMDYLQSSWGSQWESDRGPEPFRFFPVGLTMFGVHPGPDTAVTVQVTGVGYPITDGWPPIGTEVSPFHDEINIALELYATWYCRIKEMGPDAVQANALLAQYYEIAKRLTSIEDRRDQLIFSASFGTPTAVTQVERR